MILLNLVWKFHSPDKRDKNYNIYENEEAKKI